MSAHLFEPVRLGPLTLKNRTIRAAAFEGMAPGHLVSDALVAYHQAVAAGGVGMTTVAYAAVEQLGLAFAHQLWIRPEAVSGLRRLTEAVHRGGAKASIQLGHCGNMAKPEVAGGRAIAPSARFNLYGPVWPRAMHEEDIKRVVSAFGTAVRLARDAGFDAVEVHAGHGYLVSQFLSPYTNRRRDSYGGPLGNRMRFMREVLAEVKRAAGDELAVLVKTNLRDGFKGGLDLDEGLEVARTLEQDGADALVLSGGFVSRAPMYIMRGPMPMEEMSKRMPQWWMRTFVGTFGEWLGPLLSRGRDGSAARAPVAPGLRRGSGLAVGRRRRAGPRLRRDRHGPGPHPRAGLRQPPRARGARRQGATQRSAVRPLQRLCSAHLHDVDGLP